MKESAKTEKEMREVEEPWPKSKEELYEYIDSLVYREHDYGTCCYAMSLAAVATFNYVAGALGVTGFQASCADLDILRRTRSMNGPFIILKAEDMVYPQYDLPERLQEFMRDSASWVKKEAEKKLAEGSEFVHPNVLSHWKELVKA